MKPNTDIASMSEINLCTTTRQRAGQNRIKMIATVKYQVATYSGVVQVNCNENDDDEYIIAKAKRIVTQRKVGKLWGVLKMINCKRLKEI